MLYESKVSQPSWQCHGFVVLEFWPLLIVCYTITIGAQTKWIPLCFLEVHVGNCIKMKLSGHSCEEHSPVYSEEWAVLWCCNVFGLQDSHHNASICGNTRKYNFKVMKMVVQGLQLK